MNNLKHTPGPWFAHQPHQTIYIEARLRGSTIQEIASVGPTEGGSRQQSANARVLVLAPEMLALLQELVDMEGPKPGTSAWGDKALTLIHRATGE